ncbi:nitrite reductase [Vibrio sinaloensis]|uniref:nitrite reductase n=1 Tax=Photobacterium sp. (strain ATCC 43367) TaxID=379097 RepID=UPI0035E97C74
MQLVMIIAIIFGAVFGGRMLKMVLNHRKEIKQLEISQQSQLDHKQKEQLIEQVKHLSERVEVLERIVTDQKYQLDKEIASL